VLVVEDDHTARRAITLILRKQGFAASEAGTVAEALRKLTECRPEWILLDLMLPDGYGTDVLRAVRAVADASADRPGSPPRVCVITGCGLDLVTEARLLGAEQVLTKPVDVDRLIELLSGAAVG
jgi:DNA-binding response OmpR family regulator